jgi:hypothetical protein
VRVLATVIPAHPHPGRRRAANEGDGLGDNIDSFGILSGNPDLGFGAELNVHDYNGNYATWFLRRIHRLRKRRGLSFDRQTFNGIRESRL